MDVVTEARFEWDCVLAEEVYGRVREKCKGVPVHDPCVLYALSLIYVRQLRHHDFEEAEIQERREV